MKIQILGAGCAKCNKLLDNARQAVSEAQIDCQIEKVTDLKEIINFGVMVTPALVIDGEVKTAGKVIGPEEIKTMLKQNPT